MEGNMKEIYYKAIKFASEKHKYQLRKGSGMPYFVHLYSVAKILHLNGASLDLVVCGFLHDTLEDTTTTYRELRENFGDEIANIVYKVSEDKSLGYDERKSRQARIIGSSSRDVKMLKCADCLSNLSDILMEMEDDGCWSIFNAPKEKIAYHYKEMILVLSELQGVDMYEKLKSCYEKVFNVKIEDKKENQTKTSEKIFQSCTDCKHMSRSPDPDPEDSFNYDDEAYYCNLLQRTLSRSNRPYEKQDVPDDCPLTKSLY